MHFSQKNVRVSWLQKTQGHEIATPFLPMNKIGVYIPREGSWVIPAMKSLEIIKWNALRWIL